MGADQGRQKPVGTARAVASNPNTGNCGNRLLDVLPPEIFALVEPYLERVALLAGQVLAEPGDDITHATFPCEGTAISLVTVLADGRAAEAALIGCEGAAGVIISAGDKPAFARAQVQVPGSALRLEATRLEEAKLASPALRDIVSRYADSLLAQVLQSVACNALHPVEARACRWLLTMQDRANSPELPLTQEHLAEQLGVRRTTVTRVMAELQVAGAIRHSRGKVLVTNRGRLKRASCECYQAVRDHFNRVAPGLYPTGGDEG
jgi:CRP-like cAMP-binding protein